MWNHVCSAVLIDEQWVLAAGHCLVHEQRNVLNPMFDRDADRRRNKRFIINNVNLYRVPTSTFQNNGLLSDGKIFQPLKFVLKPGYKGGLYSPGDVMMIKLQHPVQWNKVHRQPICLPDSGEQFVTPEGHGKCFTAGWGENMKGTEPNWRTVDQQFGPVFGRETRVCRYAWTMQQSTIAINQFCFGKPGDRNTCAADNGSPLMCFDKRKRSWVLAGIEHIGSEECTEDAKPGLYTSVYYDVDWINRVKRDG